MIDYEYLQKICDQFPKLMELKSGVVGNDLKVVITNPKGDTLVSKEVTLSSYNLEPEEINKIMDQCAFDLICFLCLDTLKALNKSVEFSKQKQQPEKLN